ncbi:hypothetical protein Avbf_02883 [Armadillidium vulgare]|nr:hypothetical protein Avbf_02883 [Armadillidium vulgare]
MLHGRAERGPELRTLDQALQGRRTARRNLALLVLRLHVLSYSQVPPRILSREFVVSSVKACVDRRVLSSQLLPLAYARSGSNLSTKPPFWQLVCWRLLHGRAREGPELRTLDQALQGRRTTGGNFGCSSTASPRPLLLASPSEDSQPRVRCVERKGVLDRRVLSSQLLPLAYARSGSNLSTKPPFWQLVCWRLLHGRAREGPELRTLDQALQGRRTTGGNFGCSSTASPRPLLLTSPSEIDLRGNLALIASPTRGLRASSEVSRSTVRCVERKGVCGQKGALVSASAPRLRSLRKQPLYETSFLAACLLAAAARTCKRGPRTPNSRPSSARQADNGRQLWLSSTASPRPLLLTSPSEIDLRGNLALIASPTRGRASSEVSRSTVRCVERKGVCGQKGALVSASALAYARSGSNLSTKPKFFAALSAGGCCMDVQRGAPNSELSTKLCKAGGQRDATWLSLYCVSTSSPTRKSSEDSQPRVRCVERKGVCGQKGALVSASAPRLRSLRRQPLYETSFLAALSAGGCCTDVQRGPRTPNSRPSSARQADSETQLVSPCTASPRPLLLASPSEDSQPRVRCVERKGVCGQKGALVSASATRLRSLRKQPLYETSFLAALSAGGCCADVQRGPRTPNSRPSSASQADSGTQLGSSSTASPPHNSSEIDLGGNLALIASLTRGLRVGQKGALVSASAPRLRSLRKQPLYETSLLAACLLADAARTCREGPRTPNSRPSSARQADSETQLGSPCTASPRPLLLASPSEDSQPRVRCVERKGVSFCWRLLHGRAERGPELRTLDQALQGRRTARRNLALLVLRLHVLSYSQVPPRILSREFVVSSVKACVDRRVLSSSASAPRLRSLRRQPLYETSFLAACLLAAAARTCKRGPRTPNSRPSSARQADNGTQLWLSSTASPRPLLLTSPSEIDLRGNLALIASPTRGLGRVSRPPSPRERRIPLRTLPKLGAILQTLTFYALRQRQKG